MLLLVWFCLGLFVFAKRTEPTRLRVLGLFLSLASFGLISVFLCFFGASGAHSFTNFGFVSKFLFCLCFCGVSVASEALSVAIFGFVSKF